MVSFPTSLQGGGTVSKENRIASVAMSVAEKEDALGTIYSGSLIDEKWWGDERAGRTSCQLSR